MYMYSCLSTRSENTVGLTAGSCKLAAPKKLLWRAPVGTKHQIGSNCSLKISGHFLPILAFCARKSTYPLIVASL